MHFFKKIIIILIISFSFLSYSNQNIVYQDDCGIHQNTQTIDPMDISICKEDFIFNIFYTNFGGFFEKYVFPVYKFQYINDISGIDYSSIPNELMNEKISEQYKKMKTSKIFESIFKVVSEISLIFVFLFICYQVSVGILRSQESGDFFGKSFNPKKNMLYYLAAAFLLIPVGDVLVIHIIFLFIIIIAIVPANFIYTYFLYSLMINFNDYNINQISIDTPDKNNHNYYFANQYLETLTEIHLCRITTTNMVMSKNIDKNLFEEIDQQLACQLPQTKIQYNSLDKIDINNQLFNNSKGFYYYDNIGQKDISNGINFFNNLSFLNFIEKCEIDSFSSASENFDCGMITASNFSNDSNILLKNLLGNEFNQAVMNTVKLFDNSNPSFESINESWNSIKKIAIDKSVNFINQYEATKVNNLGLNKADLDRMITITTNIRKNTGDKELSELSYIFHQRLLDHILIGTLGYDLDHNGTRVINENFKNTILLEKNLDRINEISKLVMTHECLNSTEHYLLTENFLSGKRNDKKGIYCLNPENKKIFGYEYDIKNLEPEDLYKILEKYQNLINDKKNLFIEEFYKNRVAIEKSLYNSIILIGAERSLNGGKTTLIDARKKGFMSFPNILFNIDNFYSNSDSYIGIFNNTNKHYLNLKKDTKIASVKSEIAILDDSENYEQNLNFSQIYKNIFNSYKLNFKDTKYVSNIDETNTNFNSKSNPEEPTSFSSRVLDTAWSPLDNLTEAMGVSRDIDIFDKNTDFSFICLEDIEKCPVPRVNPLVSFNKLGVDYINTGTVILATTFSVYTILNINKSSTKKNLLNDLDLIEKEKNDTTITNDDKQKRKSKAKSLKQKSNLLDMLSGFASILISYALALILIGLFFAFGIPLLAFIYMLLNFINWLILVLNVWVISPLFAGYLVSVEDNENEISNFLKNYLLTIILKPTLIIVSMIFLWSFYTVTIFFLNMTLFKFISNLANMPSSGLFTSLFINKLILTVLIIYIIYQLTKTVFELITTLYEKIFEILNIQYANDDNNTNVDNFLAYMAVQRIEQSVKGNFDRLIYSNKNKNEKIKRTKEIIDDVTSNKNIQMDYDKYYDSKDLKYIDLSNPKNNKTFKTKKDMVSEILEKKGLK